MKGLIEAINRPKEAYLNKSNKAAWGIVITAVLMTTVFEPILRLLSEENFVPDIIGILIVTGIGIGSYLIECSLLWLVSRGFGVKRSWCDITRTWGISFLPNVLCAIVVAVTETYFYLFWNSIGWGMVLSIVFVGILLWKVILYLIYISQYLELKGKKMLGFLIIMTLLIGTLAWADSVFLGLKTPMA